MTTKLQKIWKYEKQDRRSIFVEWNSLTTNTSKAYDGAERYRKFENFMKYRQKQAIEKPILTEGRMKGQIKNAKSISFPIAPPPAANQKTTLK